MDADKFERIKDFGRRHGFEIVIQELYKRIVSPGDLVVDGGANEGRHTFPLANLVGSGGRVLAIEAIPLLAAQLEHKSSALPQVEVIGAAVSNRTGRTTFNFVRNATGFSGIEPRDYQNFRLDIDLIEVDCTTLDSLLEGEERPWSFLKLDLEGGELHAIQGGARVIQRERPLIIFENERESSAEFYRYSKADFFKTFAAIDYNIYDIGGVFFEEQRWSEQFVPWYFIAVPRDSRHEAFVQANAPWILTAVLNKNGYSI